MELKIAEFKKAVENSDNIVFFGGAGVSTESNIPDFRSQDGLYNQQYKYPPETILSDSFFWSNPEEFYRFYRDKILIDSAKPNITHIILADLEKQGKLKAIVTQNIDGLHEAAGSKVVFNLHGTIFKNHCTRCNKFYSLEDIKKMSGIPKCNCGAIIKPDVVLYGEGLDNDTVEGAIYAISNADILIAGGTSLVVYPAAGLINYFKGSKLILINKQPTSFDNAADLVINDSIGKVFSVLKSS